MLPMFLMKLLFWIWRNGRNCLCLPPLEASATYYMKGKSTFVIITHLQTGLGWNIDADEMDFCTFVWVMYAYVFVVIASADMEDNLPRYNLVN